MNITKENIDELNAKLRIKIEKDDYKEKVDEMLRDYRKKARMNGFRPGKVPQGLINKMYYKPVLVEEINKLVSESISSYITEQEINILGDPLPAEDEQQPIDWDNQSEFEFIFDLGIAPELDLTVTDKDKVVYYQVTPRNDLMDKYIESYTERYGDHVEAEEVTDNELLKGRLVELDENGEIKEGGVFQENATMSVDVIKDEEIKKQFTGLKKDSEVNFDLKKAYPNETEQATMLNVDKAALPEINPVFKLTITSILRFKQADLNQEFYDKVFGEGQVKSEEEFRAKLQEQIDENLKNDADYRFTFDAKEMLLNKVDFSLPDEFLKRWLMASNEGKISEEQLEKEFPAFVNDLKWQLIKNKIAKDNDIKVEETDLLNHAKIVAQQQFAQYGMPNVPDEHLTNFAQKILEKEQDRRRIYEQVQEQKIFAFVKEKVTLKEKKISMDDFEKLFEAEHDHDHDHDHNHDHDHK